MEENDEFDPDATSDLIVLGLAWKTKEDDIKEYFEQVPVPNLFSDFILVVILCVGWDGT